MKIADPTEDVAFRQWQSQYKHNAKRRGLEWKLTIVEFLELVHSDCHYCGELPANRIMYITRRGINVGTAKIKVTIQANGIDRLYCSQGYKLGNVVTCCSRCNYAKSCMTPEEFLEHARRIVYYHEIWEKYPEIIV